jgi:hypothetical protein
MTDARIRTGDVVIDLVERGKMLVVEQAAHSVKAHQQTEGYDIQTYKSHPLLDVADTEPVWTCVYLPDKPTTEFSGTYDFPESRLARVPVEEANQDLRRVQERQAVSMLEALFKMAATLDDEWSVEARDFRQAMSVLAENTTAFDDDLVSEAKELASVDKTITAEGDD